MSQSAASGWVLLTHQIPSHPSAVRVRIWRRLQSLGAIAVRQSVYVLPASPSAVEDFQWLRREIEEAGGEATVFTADVVDNAEGQEIVRSFQQARDRDYAAIQEELGVIERACMEGREGEVCPDLHRLRQRLEQAIAIDFFEAPGRAAAVAALKRCEKLVRLAGEPVQEIPLQDPSQYRRRRWVTRQHLHIDRMASVWLIRRFIDPEARFAFLEDGAAPRSRDVPFDMYEGEFAHHGDRCTFETLREAFGLQQPGLEALARIVHDADLKDGRFGRRDTEGIEKAIRALGSRLSDRELVRVALPLFDGLLDLLRQEAPS